MNKKERLALLMSDISENCWCAGWMSGLEYSVWDAIQSGKDYEYGLDVITKFEQEAVMRLAEEIGAWPVWADEVPDSESIEGLYLYWMPLDKWREHRSRMELNNAASN